MHWGSSQLVAASKGKILLVDDLPTNREIVGAYLEDGGYDVVPIGSGAEAISRLRKEKFDLVLMDIQMPNMDGVTATRAIREMGSPVREIPILAMTGNVLPQQVEVFIKAGKNDHVGKPIERCRSVQQTVASAGAQRLRQSSCAVGLAALQSRQAGRSDWSFRPGKVEQTLLALEKELCRCFKSDLAQSRREAHDLINTAGALGLETLLECARALNEADPSSDEAFRALARCRETRDGGPGDHCRNDFAAAHRVDPSKDGIVSRRCITESRDADRIQPVRVSIAYSDVQFQLPRGARASSSAASLAKSGLSRT